MVYLGKISVSIYFWHYVIYDFFRYLYKLAAQGGQIQEPQYLLYLILMLLLSILSYRYIENGNRGRAVRTS